MPTEIEEAIKLVEILADKNKWEKNSGGYWVYSETRPFEIANQALIKLRAIKAPEPTGISNTLRDIAEESCLNKAESAALIRIAKEVDQLQAKTIAGS